MLIVVNIQIVKSTRSGKIDFFTVKAHMWHKQKDVFMSEILKDKLIYLLIVYEDTTTSYEKEQNKIH